MLLEILRILTLGLRFALAGALILLLRGSGRSLGRSVRLSWMAVAAAESFYAVASLGVEILLFSRPLFLSRPGLHQLAREAYDVAYLLNSLLAAALPFVLLRLNVSGFGRRIGLPGLALAIVVTVFGLVAGAAASWTTMLLTTRALTFLSILANLAFLAAVLLGAAPRVDIYLAGYIAVVTVWTLLLPVQEVFIQLAGRQASIRFWPVGEVLQVLSTAAQLAIVVALGIALGRGLGTAPARLRLAARWPGLPSGESGGS